jgi:uncharacterized lipoprotein YmbA
VNSFYVRFALGWLVGVGVGCTSAPVRYYTLAPTPDKILPGLQTSLAIDVRVVHAPPQLNRSELMVRTGPSEVMLLENERWASPLKDEIRDAVRLELQRSFSRMSGLPAASTKLTLDIDVHRFEAEVGQHVLLEASWSAALSAPRQPSSGTRVATCTFQADEKIHGGYAGVAEGYQREIAALAEAIAGVLMSPADGTDASCR